MQKHCELISELFGYATLSHRISAICQVLPAWNRRYFTVIPLVVIDFLPGQPDGMNIPPNGIRDIIQQIIFEVIAVPVKLPLYINGLENMIFIVLTELFPEVNLGAPFPPGFPKHTVLSVIEKLRSGDERIVFLLHKGIRVIRVPCMIFLIADIQKVPDTPGVIPEIYIGITRVKYTASAVPVHSKCHCQQGAVEIPEADFDRLGRRRRLRNNSFVVIFSQKGAQMCSAVRTSALLISL